MSLIGITGKAQAGKDTLGAEFVRAGYRRISFADPLKEAVSVIAGEPLELFHTIEGKEGFSPMLNCTRRHALQAVGKGVRDVLDQGIWVRRALDAWDRMGRPNAVITDVRYTNEAELICQFGGLILHVWRPGNVGLTGVAAAHESEAGIRDDLINEQICNNGSIGELNAEARKIIDRLGPSRGAQAELL
ncbi:deoxynucleoside monophosphate kinase [Variovorax sp. PBS-H4]|uniref:deoxynucleotide monophosphate kinase family protein n=1 Tax=Variovorax sp. PBS-H4 TaxID=434008 RepID=UPI0013194AAC|nr:hypothetical protein [Variovorax sp. PBS-H4]VTU31863.1 deoxynucleoside monophosphate kinase [Variovorax sp. PBS-H4]